MSDANGSWNVSIKTPMGAQNGVLVLKADGGALSGTFTGAQGAAELAEGKVAGSDVSWKMEVNSPMGKMTLTAAGKVEGDAISGNIQLGAFGNAPFTGTRA